MSAQGGPGAVSSSATGLIDGDRRIIERAASAHKWQRVLRAILERPRTTRELECEPVFDHVVHSTAAVLRDKGLRIISERVEITGYNGLPAYVARYSVAPESRALALRLLAAGADG
jgi:hypothetical protein